MKQFQATRLFRRVTLGVLGAIIVVALAVYAWPRIAHYQLTGRWSPISKVDTLHSPVAVTGWSEDGLSLADARIVQLPGFRKLPRVSDALREVTKRGTEIAADGRVYGLVRVHHWCGNDPVREHIARVDVADMLMYLREGEWSTAPSTETLEFASRRSRGRFSEWGWNVSEFTSFKIWTQFICAEQQRGAPHFQ